MCGRVIVSRYATCGAPIFASTPYSRRSRSMMISRCSSPMPDRMVWPVSWSVRSRSDWVLAGQLLQAERHLLDRLLGARLDRDVDHRHREGHALQHHRVLLRRPACRRCRCPSARRRRRCRRRTTSLISARLSACIWNIRPMRSRWSLVVFITVSPRLQRAGVDAHEGQRAVFVVDDLERQPGERRVRVGLDAPAVGYARRPPRPRRRRPRCRARRSGDGR